MTVWLSHPRQVCGGEVWTKCEHPEDLAWGISSPAALGPHPHPSTLSSKLFHSPETQLKPRPCNLSLSDPQNCPDTIPTGAIVCTIEKANGLINQMLEEDSLGALGALVVDELHMVGDDDRWVGTGRTVWEEVWEALAGRRYFKGVLWTMVAFSITQITHYHSMSLRSLHVRGYLLELLLTKLRYATSDIAIHSPPPLSSAGSGASGGGRRASVTLAAQEGLQIIGMSATMPNVDQVIDRCCLRCCLRCCTKDVARKMLRKMCCCCLPCFLPWRLVMGQGRKSLKSIFS